MNKGLTDHQMKLYQILQEQHKKVGEVLACIESGIQSGTITADKFEDLISKSSATYAYTGSESMSCNATGCIDTKSS